VFLPLCFIMFCGRTTSGSYGTDGSLMAFAGGGRRMIFRGILLVTLAFFFILPLSAVHGAEWYVDSPVARSGDGTTWERPTVNPVTIIGFAVPNSDAAEQAPFTLRNGQRHERPGVVSIFRTVSFVAR
jgi:hypothetical protein